MAADTARDTRAAGAARVDRADKAAGAARVDRAAGAARVDRAVIIIVVITMDSITGRVTRIMDRVMAVILTGIMALAGAVQGMYVVTCGVQIHSVNVWEVICAVAFKDKGSSMGRHTYGTCGNFNSFKRCY